MTTHEIIMAILRRFRFAGLFAPARPANMPKLPRRNNSQAIARDWRAVGNDLRWAMGQRAKR